MTSRLWEEPRTGCIVVRSAHSSSHLLFIYLPTYPPTHHGACERGGESARGRFSVRRDFAVTGNSARPPRGSVGGGEGAGSCSQASPPPHLAKPKVFTACQPLTFYLQFSLLVRTALHVGNVSTGDAGPSLGPVLLVAAGGRAPGLCWVGTRDAPPHPECPGRPTSPSPARTSGEGRLRDAGPASGSRAVTPHRGAEGAQHPLTMDSEPISPAWGPRPPLGAGKLGLPGVEGTSAWPGPPRSSVVCPWLDTSFVAMSGASADGLSDPRRTWRWSRAS